MTAEKFLHESTSSEEDEGAKTVRKPNGLHSRTMGLQRNARTVVKESREELSSG
jgi:hypothetical protein